MWTFFKDRTLRPFPFLSISFQPTQECRSEFKLFLKWTAMVWAKWNGRICLLGHTFRGEQEWHAAAKTRLCGLLAVGYLPEFINIIWTNAFLARSLLSMWSSNQWDFDQLFCCLNKCDWANKQSRACSRLPFGLPFCKNTGLLFTSQGSFAQISSFFLFWPLCSSPAGFKYSRGCEVRAIIECYPAEFAPSKTELISHMISVN